MHTKTMNITTLYDGLIHLTNNSPIFVLSLILLTFLFVKRSRNSKNPPLPPGPRGLPLVGNLLSLEPDQHKYFAFLSTKYGHIFTLKLGRKIAIVVNSPALAKEVLKDQDVIFANRDVPMAGKELAYGGLDILWSPYGPEWRMLRKVVVREMFSNKTLDMVYDLRRRELRETIKYLYASSGSPVNVGEQMFLTVLNVITSMLWGGTMKGDERAGIAMEFKNVIEEILQMLGTPNLSDLFPALSRFDLQGIQKKTKSLSSRFDKIFEKIIEQRLQNIENGGGVINNENTDFLQFLLQMENAGSSDDKTRFTMTHVKSLLMDMVVGGTDTTSTTIEFALAEMMNKPEVLKKVQQELEEVVGKDNIVEETDINKLPYLYAVMKEVLRLHPTLPLLVSHCPSVQSIVGGYTIPKGACVIVNVWAVHRDPFIWKDPLEFCPERFLDMKFDYSGNNFTYFPFGSGRRICAGTAMAERMFMYSLASLVHSFDWNLPMGETIDLAEKFGIVMRKKIPLVVIPTPKLSDPCLYE